MRLYIVDQSGLEPGGHYYSYTRCIADGAHEVGVEPIILANKKFRILPEAAPNKILPCFTYSWGEAEEYGQLAWRDGNLANELFRALRQIPPEPGDHVFIHTLGYRELQALLEWFTRRMLPGDPIPFFDVLLRRDPDILIANYGEYAAAFAAIVSSPFLRRKVRFHADTELLSTAFASLTGLEFATAPIPFPQHHLIDALASRPPRSEGEPLLVAYLGDARIEKGYQHLPAAVAFLNRDYLAKRKLRLVAQSNFNIPGGEPGIRSAAQNLAGLSGIAFESEALGEQDYYRLLAGADIVLLPYSAAAYRRRSSGVLIEAMAAGKVVVTSSNSWMATAVSPERAVLFEDPRELGPAIATAVDNFAALSEAARMHAPAVLDSSTGRALVRHLCGGPGLRTEKPSAAGPGRVLLIMDGDAMVLRNGSSRVAQAQLHYLGAAGFNILCLFLANNEQNAAEATEWRAALADAIRPFAPDRVFVAAPGAHAMPPETREAIAQERQPPKWPLRADFDAACGFAFGGELLIYLREHPVDAVLLNCIPNYPVIDALGLTGVPVICEISDLQSKQRAIYSKRLVSPDDLKEEVAWLSRCAALISLNPTESELLHERLPTVPIETTGVWLPSPPSTLTTLAGVADFSELIGLAGPMRPEDVRPSLDELAELGFLDLLFVSSNHLANLSGFQWFLREVFEPALMSRGISLLVAGSICEIPGLPDLPGVFYLGRVDDLAPLYGAARIVILPITEGAGSPVKTVEALAYGRAVIGTPLAFRGLSNTTGLLITEDAAEFAAAILRLLASEEARERYAAASLSIARQYNSPAAYFATMDRIFGRIAGRLDTAAPAVPFEESAYLEWSLLTQSLNQLCRAYLEGSTLPGYALGLLEAAPPGWDLPRLIETASRSLLAERDAAILRKLPELNSRAAARPGQAAADMGFVIGLAVAAHRGVPLEPPLRLCRRIALSLALPIRLATTNGDAVAIDELPLRWRSGPQEAFSGIAFKVADIPAGEGDGFRVVQYGPDRKGTAGDLLFRQSVPLTPDSSVLTRKTLDGDLRAGTNGLAELGPRARGILRIPTISDGTATRFADLVLLGRIGDEIEWSVNGAAARPELTRTGGITLARLLIEPGRAGQDFGVVEIGIANTATPSVLRLAGAHAGLLIGSADAGFRMASALCLDEACSIIAKPARAAESAQAAVLQVIRGQPIPPSSVSLLADLIHAGNRNHALESLVTQALRREAARTGGEGSRPSIEAVVDDVTAIVDAYLDGRRRRGPILSPALAVEAIDETGQVLRAETEMVAAERRGRWCLAQLKSGMVCLRVRLGAALAIPGYPGIIRSAGFHPPETKDSQFRWTGPGPISTITLPLVADRHVRVEIGLGANGGNSVTEDFALRCNGREVPLSVVSQPDGYLLKADPPAATAAAPWTEIELTVRHLFHPPPPDLRTLGVVFKYLQLTMPFMEAHGEQTAAPADDVKAAAD